MEKGEIRANQILNYVQRLLATQQYIQSGADQFTVQ